MIYCENKSQKLNMGSQNLSCDWQLGKSNVLERAEHLLRTEQMSDCQFIVGTEPHQKTFNAHKLFLAMSSPVFEAMFFGGIAEKKDAILILDVQPDGFKSLLNYIYFDQVDLFSFDKACELCYAAKKYMLPHLVEKCIEYLSNNLCAKNACKAYEFGKLFEEHVLMENSLQVILTETEAVLTDPSFEDVQLDTLLLILDKERLNISSETDLFNAVYRWASKECTRKGLPQDGESLRNVIGPALEKIRFLTLTPLQFAEGPALVPLLKRDESFAILMNVSNPGPNFPMPVGFSRVVEPRRKPTIFSLKDLTSRAYSAVADDSNIFYCKRDFVPFAPCYNGGSLDCSLNFTVDKQIRVLGIQIPTQLNPNQIPYIARYGGVVSNSYSEILYAHLLDSDGSRLTYTHFTSKVSYGDVIEISFNKPVYIRRRKPYQVVVVLNKPGWYPLGSAAEEIKCDSVLFNFNTRFQLSSQESLFRSVVFTY